MPADPLPVLGLTFTVALSAACGGDDLMLPADAGAARIEIAAGDGQSGRVATMLEDSIVVQVADATGRPVLGQRVTFTVTEGEGGELLPPSATTDDDGRAGTRWTLGRDVGTQRARAAIALGEGEAGSAVTFTASAAAGLPRSLAPASGDGQSGPAGSTLAEPLVVWVADEFGNPVSGVTVSWAARDGGSVSPPQSATASDGRASTRWTLGPRPGSNEVSAVVTGVGTAQFKARGTNDNGSGDDAD